MKTPLVNDRYKIIKPLGKGGMAVVYLVEDLHLSRKVALKTIRPGICDNRNAIKRFEKEAKICASISHRNVISILDFGSRDDGSVFYTMDYLPYPDLATLIDKGQVFTNERASDIVRQLADGLSACHEKGVIHRDIKPSNVLVKKDGTAILADFGLVYNKDCTRMTATGEVVGTPLYVSPEQILDNELDGRSDIYQLGLLYYELLTRKHLLDQCVTFPELMRTIASPDFSPSSMMSKNVTGRTRDIISKCIARNADDRFEKAQDLVDALDGKHFENLAQTVLTKRPKDSLFSAKNVDDGASLQSKLASYILLFGILLGLLIVGVTVGLFGTRKHVWHAENLRLTSSVDSVTATWLSKEPYSSTISLDGNLHSPSKIATTIHRVTVSGLKPGSKHTVFVIYPSGDHSLPKSVMTKRIPREIKRREVFKKALDSFFASPSISGKRELLHASKGVSDSYALPLINSKVNNCSSMLNDGERPSEYSFKKVAHTYGTLYELLCAHMDDNEKTAALYLQFLDSSMAFLRLFGHHEQLYRRKGRRANVFRRVALAATSSGTTDNLMFSLDYAYLRFVKSERPQPQSFRLLRAFILYQSDYMEKAANIAKDVRHEISKSGNVDDDSNTLVMCSYSIEIRSLYKLLKPELAFERCKELLAFTKKLPEGWSNGPYQAINKTLVGTFLKCVNELRKSKTKPKKETDDLCVTIVSQYKRTTFVQTFIDKFSSSEYLTKEENRRLRERMEAAL